MNNQCEQNNSNRGLGIDDIYAEHDDFIRSVIQYAARHNEDQDDIYQEVFVALSQKEGFDDISNLKGYLYRLVVNKVNELMRKKVAADLRLRKYVQWRAAEDHADIGQALIIEDEVVATVRLLKDKLSKKESQAILLRFRDEYDNEQAAEEMNVQKETFIRYISVGLKKIRNIMKSQKGPE